MKKVLLIMIFSSFIMIAAAYAGDTFEQTLKSAENGDVKAQFRAAMMFDKGEGVAQVNRVRSKKHRNWQENF